MKQVTVKLDALCISRFYLREEDIKKYAAMKTPFPPIKIADGRTIGDGNHRVAAAKLRGDKTIRAIGNTIDPTIIVEEDYAKPRRTN